MTAHMPITPCDLAVLNAVGRFHPVRDAIDRLSQTGDAGARLGRSPMGTRIGHSRPIHPHGQDLPEVRNRSRGAPT
jgi:xylulose-5-phosphate/fructose-6-phosphate phosphoketolase